VVKLKSHIWGIIIALAIIGFLFSDKSDSHEIKTINDTTTVSNTSSTQQPKNNETTPAEVDEIGINEVLKVGDVLFRVEEVSSQKSISDGFARYTADGTFLIVVVSLKNIGNESITTDTSFFEIQLGDKRYSPSSLITIEDQFMFDGLNPDIQKSGRIFFDVPEEVANSKDLRLNVQSGFWGTEQGDIYLR
jgi:hypothetical protein